jgi:hypothetical protein
MPLDALCDIAKYLDLEHAAILTQVARGLRYSLIMDISSIHIAIIRMFYWNGLLNNPPLNANANYLFCTCFLLEKLFDQLLFFNEEGSDYSILDAIRTTGPSIGTLHCLLVLGESGIFTGSKSGNLDQHDKMWDILRVELFHSHRILGLCRAS